MPVTPVPGGGTPGSKPYKNSAIRRSSSGGVTTGEVEDPGLSMQNFMNMLGSHPGGPGMALRDIEPLEMPSMSISPEEFRTGSAASQKFMDKKYPNAGKKGFVGSIEPNSGPSGGWTDNYQDPGNRYSQTSGGMSPTSGGYAPQGDENLQGALASSSLGMDSPQAPPDVFRALKRRRIIDQVNDPMVASMAAQYGIIPGDEVLRKVRGY